MLDKPACADHPHGKVVRWGKGKTQRKQRWVCLEGKPHAPKKMALTEDLLGVCVVCSRDWQHGHVTARRAQYHLDAVVGFLRRIGAGESLGKAMREARETHRDRLDQRALMVGVPRPKPFPPPRYRPRAWAGKQYEIIYAEEDARLAGDWLDRYGGLLVAHTAPRRWSDAPLVVDATKFKLSSVYGGGTTKAGQPKRGGDWGFAVLAAGTPTKQGFRVVHVRAFPDDGKQSWLDFFNSLPGRPSMLMADAWDRLTDAARIVWPGIEIRSSSWHQWDAVRKHFNRARWYPGTHQLVADGWHAFADPDEFVKWRARAEQNAPKSVQKWLKNNGDRLHALISGDGPYTTGAIEAYLKLVRRALAPGRGRITNLTRLDIRLGLLMNQANRSASARRYESELRAALTSHELVRLPWRSLDSAGYRQRWIVKDIVA